MGTEPTQEPGRISVGDFDIQSGQASEDQLKEQFKDEIEQDTKDAASKLGKKGAAAKKAKAEAEPPEAEEAPEETPEQKAGPESEEPEEEAEDKDKKLGKPKHDPRARVQQAVAQKNQAERERDEALSKLSTLEERLSRLEKGEKPTPEKAASPERGPEKPDPSGFNDYEEYLDARDEWNLKRWTQQHEQESRQREQMSEQDRALAQAVDKFRDSVGQDISNWSDEVLQLKTEFQLGDNEAPSAENWIANELVFNPESAATLGLYLSQHPDEFQAIASLSTPRDVSRAMAKLEARLEAVTTGTRSERVEKSEAPPPVKPVRGGAHVGDADPGPKSGESFDAWWKRTKPGNPYR